MSVIRDPADLTADCRAERRKNREEAWNQQDIVAEAIKELLEKSTK